MLTKAEIEAHFSEPVEFPREGRVHFVGIGGAGLAPLAHLLLLQGREVSGSDLVENASTERLAALGARITIGHSTAAVPGAAIVVVSDAIELGANAEYLEAVRLQIPVIRRSRLLGFATAGKRLVAVAGTHGKSTVAAFLGQLLELAGLDPLVINGADVASWNGSIRVGTGEWAVVEACEAFNGMLDLSPDLIVLTNLEPDHLEFHGSYENLISSMQQFVRRLGSVGKLVYCNAGDAAQMSREVEHAIEYGFGVGAMNAAYDGVLSVFGKEVRLKTIGKHNALNMLGALAAAQAMGCDVEKLIDRLGEISGCIRRLEVIGEQNGIMFIEDYAHHPSELSASIIALRQTFPGRRIVCIYQPLTYARVQAMLPDFIRELSKCDLVVITDIFSSRESPIPGVSAVRIVEGLEKAGVAVVYVPSVFALPKQVMQLIREGDVVVDTGAGATNGLLRKVIKRMDRGSHSLRVLVLAGGFSAEREVSKLGGQLVTAALKSRGFDAALCDPAEMLMKKMSLEQLAGENAPDLVFPVLHGPFDEDGKVQGLLELLGIPYVGSDPLSSALAMDKFAAKQWLAAAGLRVPTGVLVDSSGASIPLELPVAVKPNSQGSTCGLSIVRTGSELEPALRKALKYDRRALVEEFLPGTEITVPVLGEEALPSVEIQPHSGFYNFESKYVPGATDEISPARISPELETEARRAALLAHHTLGCSDFSRTDMIIRDGEIYVLEINTIPGMTPTSLVPTSAAAAGIDFAELCERLISLACVRYGIKKA